MRYPVANCVSGSVQFSQFRYYAPLVPHVNELASQTQEHIKSCVSTNKILCASEIKNCCVVKHCRAGSWKRALVVREHFFSDCELHTFNMYVVGAKKLLFVFSATDRFSQFICDDVGSVSVVKIFECITDNNII